VKSNGNKRGGLLMMASPRKTLAAKLVAWVGIDLATVISPGNGWPSHLRIQTQKGVRLVSAYTGPIGESHRDRDGERRFQNPGKGRPIEALPNELALLLGLSEETGSPIVVGMDAIKRLGRATRQSLFMPLSLLHQAAREGWADHVSTVGERIIAFAPERLPEYVELCAKKAGIR
jgi:hypothetical protein